MEAISNINSIINGFVWGVPMMILIVGTGIYLTIGTGFLQFTRVFYIMKHTMGACFKKREAKKGSITPVQALTTALAATVGTGNIAGVAGAIALGGPGAVFWMWVSALFGMATKFSEVTLAIHYRERNKCGDWVGGPMYYIKKGLGKRFNWLATMFACFAALASFGIGNMTQVNTIAGSVSTAIVQFIPSAQENIMIINVIIGVIMAITVGLVLIGGVKRIGAVTEKLIPAMAAIYIIGSLCVIYANKGNIGYVFNSIFEGAFNPKAVTGGVVSSMFISIQRGVGRGVFSNEAGLGSAPIAHAAADTDSAVRQGLFGIFEVFADTIVICTLTAFTILVSGVYIPYGETVGAELTISAFTGSFGGKASAVVVAIAITLFAASTILSWGLYGTRCTEFLFGQKSVKAYQILFILFIVIGATIKLQLAWEIADTLNGMMAIPNLIALLLLSKKVIKLTKDHFKKKI